MVSLAPELLALSEPWQYLAPGMLSPREASVRIPAPAASFPSGTQVLESPFKDMWIQPVDVGIKGLKDFSRQIHRDNANWWWPGAGETKEQGDC